MSVVWDKGDYPPAPKPGLLGWLLIVLRGLALVFVVFGGLTLLLLIRLIEAPVHGLYRPWTPWITQTVCRCALFILGIGFFTQGKPMKERGAIVANHSSWLDIFTLNARKRIYFVSKAEVANWPGIGWLARATGTVFITRDPREAKVQQQIFEARLLAGHKLLFFPEGTSSDAMRVLPFKSTLFQAFLTPDLRHEMHIQPVTVIYQAPDGFRDDFYGWWGDMGFGEHLLMMLASRKHGAVKLVYHAPVRADAYPDRKALAADLETRVRSGMPIERQVKET